MSYEEEDTCLFAKALDKVAFQSKCTRALTFETNKGDKSDFAMKNASPKKSTELLELKRTGEPWYTLNPKP